MDHADDWCDATWDAQSHTWATNSDARSDASDPDASDSHSATTHWWLRAREGLQCERMVHRHQFRGVVPPARAIWSVSCAVLQAGLSRVVVMTA